jgi:large subunit ribosomal protein L15
MSLSHLRAPRGASRGRTRVGRGQASGQGKTAGRGGKGQKARTGNMRFEGFEGGQMPLQRRLPKFGFTPISRRELAEVQVGSLASMPAGTVVDAASLEAAGLIRGHGDGVVVLGTGELAGALTVKADRVTAGARAAIEKAGGKVEIIPRLQTIGEKAKAARALERASEKAAKGPEKAAEKAPEKVKKSEKKSEKTPEKAAEKTPEKTSPGKG